MRRCWWLIAAAALVAVVDGQSARGWGSYGNGGCGPGFAGVPVTAQHCGDGWSSQGGVCGPWWSGGCNTVCGPGAGPGFWFGFPGFGFGGCYDSTRVIGAESVYLPVPNGGTAYFFSGRLVPFVAACEWYEYPVYGYPVYGYPTFGYPGWTYPVSGPVIAPRRAGFVPRYYHPRGLRPHFPETWEDGVMSYLKAKDGATFKYIETDYGSKFVEFPKGGGLFTRRQPVLHYARAWKTPVVKAGNGYLHDWVGVADNGDFIGLDNAVRGYCLFPQPDTSATHLRLNAVPENLVIIAAKVEADLAVVEVGPRERKQEKPAISGNVEGTAGKPITPITGTIGIVTDKPLLRIASAHQPAPVLKPLGQRDGNYRYELTGTFWGELAFVWREGVYAPFEPSDDYLLPVTAAPPPEPGEFFAVLQPFDQRWNAEIGGPRNPRPGTVYQAPGTAQKSGDKAGNLSFFLTNPSTKGSGLFADTFGAKVESNEPQPVAFTGVRQPKLDVVGVRDLALRSFPIGEKNVRLTRLDPIRFIRPTLRIDRIDPIDLGQVAKGAATVSAKREIANSQTAAATAGGKTFPTVLYGAARITAPDAKRPDIQENDHTGVILIGKDAKLFRLKGEHPAPGGGLLLVGADGQPGLSGGAEPEKEAFAVAFLGTPEPGDYTATVRIVTQAGNLGVCSAGKDDEPLAGLFYVDMTVKVKVQ